MSFVQLFVMGTKKCCVGGCNATSETHRLFSFPKNVELGNLWMSFLVPTNSLLIGLTTDQLYKKRVCEKHFDKHQFDHEGRRLRYSYPCLITNEEIAHGVPLSAADSLQEAVPQDCNTSENRLPRIVFEDFEEFDQSLLKKLPKQRNVIRSENKLLKRPQKKLQKKLQSFSQNQRDTVKKIKLAPRRYIGIPSYCYFVVKFIVAKHRVPEAHILLCLKKIRLNTSFKKLCLEFGILGEFKVRRLFFKTVPIIASSIYHFIRKLKENNMNEPNEIQLPTDKIDNKSYCQRTSCIIDCLEIEIQKPLEMFNENLTISESRGTNVIKYLISCTCDGLVDYVSQGYVGSISDKLLVNYCNYSDLIRSGRCFLGDSGLKDIERPKEVKQIARLKCYINRVMQGIRDFAILDPQSVIDTTLYAVLDDITVIVCALLNLKHSFLKIKYTAVRAAAQITHPKAGLA